MSNRTRPVPEHVQRAIQDLLERHSPAEVSRRCEVSRSVVLSAAAGQGVLPGSLALLERALGVPEHQRSPPPRAPGATVRYVPIGRPMPTGFGTDEDRQQWALRARELVRTSGAEYVVAPGARVTTPDGSVLHEGDEVHPEHWDGVDGQPGWRNLEPMVERAQVLRRSDWV